MRERWVETVVGLVVLALAATFLVYALDVGGAVRGSGGYVLTARFDQVGGLAPGASVRVAGVKVGTVSAVTLDPKTYLAVTRLALDTSVRLPADSTAKIGTDGLLGGVHVSIAPGGAPENLKANDEIENTQGSVDLFGLIGQVIRPQPGGGEDARSVAPGPPIEPASR
jgi:phospholipid/cholesterol/gamma-HCH transport system substrate-binding protein